MTFAEEATRLQTQAAMASSEAADAALHARNLSVVASNMVRTEVVERPGGPAPELTTEQKRQRTKANLIAAERWVTGPGRGLEPPRPTVIRDPHGNCAVVPLPGSPVVSIIRPGDDRGSAISVARERAEDDQMFRNLVHKSLWAELGVPDGPVHALPPGLEGL